MANLGDFFELVFAAKVYQRLNPGNYSINIKNGQLTETFNNKTDILNGKKIENFLNSLYKQKQIVGKQIHVDRKSVKKKYTATFGEETIKDEIQCFLYVRSYIQDITLFKKFYTNETKITEEHIHNTFENLKNNTKKITKGVAALKAQYKNKDFNQLDKKTTDEIKKSIQTTERKNINDKISRRKRNFDRILDYNIEIVPEIKTIIKLRNSYLVDKVKQNLTFEIEMTGQSNEEDKLGQGKTDIKINFIVSYTENKIKKTENYTYRISLKYDSDRLETASQTTIDNLNQLLYISATRDADNRSDNLKKLICNLIYDNIDNENPQSLIKFTGTKTLYLRKDKLMTVLNQLNYSDLKKDTINNENFIITYNDGKEDRGFLRIRKGTDNYTIETLDYFNNEILELIDPTKKPTKKPKK